MKVLLDKIQEGAIIMSGKLVEKKKFSISDIIQKYAVIIVWAILFLVFQL